MKVKTMQRRYLWEAAVMLFGAQLAVRFVPPARIFAWADRPPRRVRRFAVWQTSWIAWAVEYLGAMPWINAGCLPRALATQAMLRRRGIASRFCLGVAREAEGGGVLAHAWVEVGNRQIVGVDEAAAFTRLADFGGAR